MGSGLHHFLEPLADDMLECIHATKSRNLTQQQLKDDSQKEAKSQVIKAKQQTLHINNICLPTQEHVEPLKITLNLESASKSINT